MIVIGNTLIKQTYGIAKSGLAYDENYRSILAKKELFLSSVPCWFWFFYFGMNTSIALIFILLA